MCAADAAVLIGIIDSSQRRESAHIYRCTGGNHELTAFETWCPKAFAGIGHLPDTVMDRSIVLRLERQAPTYRYVCSRRNGAPHRNAET